jgi:hypothetical protein
MRVLNETANGYAFFSATDTLFNPQLVHYFLAKLKRRSDPMPTGIVDGIRSSPVTRCSSPNTRGCCAAASRCECAEGHRLALGSPQVHKLNFALYLFELGVLSLTQLRQEKDDSDSTFYKFSIPNANARRGYAQAYFERHANATPNSAAAFVLEPTAKAPTGLLEAERRRLRGDGWVHRHHRAEDAGRFHPSTASQCLLAAESNCLELTIDEPRRSYSHTGLDKLKALTPEALLTLQIKYRGHGSFDTVDALHQAAEKQVQAYGATVAAGTSTKTLRLFAMTQVVNRFYLTQPGSILFHETSLNGFGFGFGFTTRV